MNDRCFLILIQFPFQNFFVTIYWCDMDKVSNYIKCIPFFMLGKKHDKSIVNFALFLLSWYENCKEKKILHSIFFKLFSQIIIRIYLRTFFNDSKHKKGWKCLKHFLKNVLNGNFYVISGSMKLHFKSFVCKLMVTTLALLYSQWSTSIWSCKCKNVRNSNFSDSGEVETWTLLWYSLPIL